MRTTVLSVRQVYREILWGEAEDCKTPRWVCCDAPDPQPQLRLSVEAATHYQYPDLGGLADQLPGCQLFDFTEPPVGCSQCLDMKSYRDPCLHCDRTAYKEIRKAQRKQIREERERRRWAREKLDQEPPRRDGADSAKTRASGTTNRRDGVDSAKARDKGTTNRRNRLKEILAES